MCTESPISKRAYIDVEKLGNVQRQTLDFNFADDRLKNTAANHAGGFADKMERHMHLNLRRQIDFVQIGMNHIAANRMILHIFDQRHFVRQRRGRRLQAHQMRTFQSRDRLENSRLSNSRLTDCIFGP